MDVGFRRRSRGGRSDDMRALLDHHCRVERVSARAERPTSCCGHTVAETVSSPAGTWSTCCNRRRWRATSGSWWAPIRTISGHRFEKRRWLLDTSEIAKRGVVCCVCVTVGAAGAGSFEGVRKAVWEVVPHVAALLDHRDRRHHHSSKPRQAQRVLTTAASDDLCGGTSWMHSCCFSVSRSLTRVVSNSCWWS